MSKAQTQETLGPSSVEPYVVDLFRLCHRTDAIGVVERGVWKPAEYYRSALPATQRNRAQIANDDTVSQPEH